MSIKTSVYSVISGTGAITSLATGGVHPQNIPAQSTAPAITFSMDDDADQQLLDGVSGLKEARFVIDCYSLSYLTADQMASAVKTALVGYRGAFGTNTAEHIRKERELDLFEADTRLHRVNLQFLIAYS